MTRFSVLSWILLIVGIILIADQLYLFGIPIGPFLPDLSHLDPTDSSLIHHWMLGVVLVIVALCLPKGRRRC